MKYMGFTKIKATVTHPTHPDGHQEVELLVDTGATFSAIPRSVLQKLDIPSVVSREFTMADGSKISRGMGAVLMEVKGLKAVVPVLFAEEQDMALLGVTAMEALGLEVDPTTHTVKQVPIIQALYCVQRTGRTVSGCRDATQDFSPDISNLFQNK